MIAPVIGGVIIASRGIVSGVHLGLIITFALAALTHSLFVSSTLFTLPHPEANIFGVWDSLQAGLKRLLISDIFIRTCEGMADVLIILYITNVLHVSFARFGTLVAVSTITTLLIYLPAAKAADRIGRRPFIIATFLCVRALSPGDYRRAQFCRAGDRIHHRRSARDRRARPQGNDCGLCRAAAAGAHGSVCITCCAA